MLNELNIFDCYIEENNPLFVCENTPETDKWCRYLFKHIEWWRYDLLLHNDNDSCFFKVKETLSWSVNEIKSRRLLLEFGLIEIQTSDNLIFKDNLIEMISDEVGETLSVFYNEKILLSMKEEQRIEKDLEVYNDKEKISKFKPPFHRMIIEMDIARRIGGYSREDILNMSKKDLDTIYLLHRLGMTLPIKENIDEISKKIQTNNSEKQIFQNKVDFIKKRQNDIGKLLNNVKQ
jgi:hypothetical protein